MTVYAKWLACWLGMFICAAVAGLLALYVSNLFIVAFFASVAAGSWVLNPIACEHCGAAVSQTVDDFDEKPRGIRVPVRIFKHTCHVCGGDLSKHAA